MNSTIIRSLSLALTLGMFLSATPAHADFVAEPFQKGAASVPVTVQAPAISMERLTLKVRTSEPVVDTPAAADALWTSPLGGSTRYVPMGAVASRARV